MNGSYQVGGAPLSDVWRQVIDLGVQLLEITRSQPDPGSWNSRFHRLIVDSCSHIFGGQARLWLAESFTRLLSGNSQTGVLSGSLTPLAQQTFASGRACLQVADQLLELPAGPRFTPAAGDLAPAAICLPLIVPAAGEQEPLFIGVLQLQRAETLLLSSTEIDLAFGLASQLALALAASLPAARAILQQDHLERLQHDNARSADTRDLALHSSGLTRLEHLTAISEVSNSLTALLDEDTLLAQVVDLIHTRFGYPYVHIFSVQPGLGRIVFNAGSGSRSEIAAAQDLSYELDDPQGLIPWVVRHADTRLVNDVAEDPLYRPSPLPPKDSRSEMTIPLIFAGEVLGVLDVQSDRLGAFSEEDRFVFETLADNIAIAMRNAQLFRTETWRRQVADSMHAVVGMLSRDASLEAVLEAILEEIQHTLPLEAAAIWLSESTLQPGFLAAEISLHLSAVHAARLPAYELEIGSSPEQIFDRKAQLSNRQPGDPARPSAWLVDAIQAGHPLIRATGAPYDPLAALLDFPPQHSAIAAPLKIGENIFGVLSLLHRDSARFGREAKIIVETFGNYAAVAIENTRLYEAAHEQAWLSTVLLRVAEATQELIDLDELLETVIHITPSLAGVNACLLYLKDEDDSFIPAAASGLDRRQQLEFRRRLFASGEVPALDDLLETREAHLLTRDGVDLPLWEILGQPGQAGGAPGAALVPLLSREELLGAFVLAFSPQSAPGKLQHLPFTDLDEWLAIVQGIAHQTAVAVENIRLLSAQKEAAYVSVALLQVAQAVVSSADLLEALGAIVRITPILVGVDRAVLFLWDPSRQVFRSVQAYGTSHDTSPFEYESGQFPLLEAVRDANRLFVHPLPVDRDSFQDAPDDWSFLIPPDLEEIDYLLEESGRLLLAMPLSVKDALLGVLVVEEPLPAQGAALYTRSNRRQRGKRLEILTGVSQQSALAIQNDILQRELVERERLERELQLARQIQRTFLPDIIPHLPGWDLRVCWRTAREVGGDFYDFFELPDQRLGLVIADVADKGMPAALFMTVVRSLVRASLDVETSPSSVLERVNNLVVPDAAQGMFITLAYAVLDLRTGQLEFANAGHNPPLLVRHERCAIEKLERGGMALGVLVDSRIQGGSNHLQSGDFLVMYTDGVTEAFSPQDEIFGDELLHSTILAEIACQERDGGPDAQRLVDAIDQRVSEFIAGSSRSDDLTLLVLKRL